VLATGGVVPFDAEPGALCALDSADVPHRAQGTAVGHALPDVSRFGHYVSNLHNVIYLQCRAHGFAGPRREGAVGGVGK